MDSHSKDTQDPEIQGTHALELGNAIVARHEDSIKDARNLGTLSSVMRNPVNADALSLVAQIQRRWSMGRFHAGWPTLNYLSFFRARRIVSGRSVLRSLGHQAARLEGDF